MTLSVIICTYNRSHMLTKTLESIAASIVPSSIEWEVLVVDNNSIDQTRAVIEEFCRRHPERFRYVFEPKQGLSHARNAGIRQSRGETLAFTDDDITVDPHWLWNLTAALHDDSWAGAGGRIIPVWNYPPPRWFPLEHPWGSIVEFDRGSEPGVLSEPPLGANMAFRREMIEKYGDFRPDLGRCGENLISSEDIEFGRRLLTGGERLRYEPSSVVYHPVPESRLRKDYILAWWFGRARSEIRENGVPPSTKFFLTGVPLILFPKFMVWTLLWMISLNPAKRFHAKLTLWNIAGAIVECHQQARSKVAQKSSEAVRQSPLL